MQLPLDKIFKNCFLACTMFVLVLLTACNKDNKNPDHKSISTENGQIDSTIIRNGIIDLEMIDENKDGMVYQDPMDWNVISDKPGKCPLCKMWLKEVTINEAKEILLQNDYGVK